MTNFIYTYPHFIVQQLLLNDNSKELSHQNRNWIPSCLFDYYTLSPPVQDAVLSNVIGGNRLRFTVAVRAQTLEVNFILFFIGPETLDYLHTYPVDVSVTGEEKILAVRRN